MFLAVLMLGAGTLEASSTPLVSEQGNQAFWEMGTSGGAAPYGDAAEDVTPDQSWEYFPDTSASVGEEGPVPPRGRFEGDSGDRAGTRSVPPGRCTAPRSRYQRKVESLLGLKADGKQSAADCRAIRAFQRKYGVEPANGAAGAITYTTLYARWASARPGRLKGCPASRKRIVCVDLSHQILWVKKRGKVLFGPVPIRSGRPGHETRTGWFRVYWRHKAHWSTAYHSPMPYSQFFSGGQAFHGIYSNLLRNPASYGCVNLRYDDSVKLWKILRKNDKVRIWGRRPR